MLALLVAGVGVLIWYTKQPDVSPPGRTTQENNRQETSQNSYLETIDSTQVNITSNGFNPKAIKVKAGTVVTWTNADSVPHGLKSSDIPLLDTNEPLNPGDQYSFTFEEKGMYTYSDPQTPGFTGTVTVE